MPMALDKCEKISRCSEISELSDPSIFTLNIATIHVTRQPLPTFPSQDPFHTSRECISSVHASALARRPSTLGLPSSFSFSNGYCGSEWILVTILQATSSCSNVIRPSSGVALRGKKKPYFRDEQRNADKMLRCSFLFTQPVSYYQVICLP